MPNDETRTRPAATGEVSEDRLGGAGRALIAVYIVLAIAATFRSVYQLLTKFDEAPLAYSLSAVAGVVYIVAAVALIKGRPGRAGTTAGAWRGIAVGALVFELVGVLVVGSLSFIAPELFDHPSVWSWFGAGYLCIPLALPVLGLIWLARDRRLQRARGQLQSAGKGI